MSGGPRRNRSRIGPLLALLALCAGQPGVQAAELVVRLEPDNGRLEKNISNHIGELGDRDEAQLLRYSPLAREQAEQALQALGYYRGQIDIEIRRKDNVPQLVLRITPGEPVRLRQVQVQIEGEAARLAEFQSAGQALKSGEVLDHGVYEGVKQQIFNLASRYGFFRGHFSRSRLAVNPQAGWADVALVYSSGPRFRFGQVQFSGDDPFDRRLLEQMVPFRPDTPYDAQQVAALSQALESSGYFSSVRVDTDPSAVQGSQLPVRVHLVTRKPVTMGVGFGLSTDIGPRMSFDWTRHWVNPQGHSYGTRLELSSPRRNIGFWYDIPQDPPLTRKLRFAGGYQYLEVDNSDTRSSLVTLGPEWHARLDSGWDRIYSLKWLNEQYRRGNDSGFSTFLMPGLSLSHLYADNPLNPGEGYRVDFQLAVARAPLLSNASLLRTEITLKGLTTFRERHRLLVRGQFGGNFTDRYKSVPPSLRFFAGGAQSVRGYTYQHLSPKNSDNDRIGGRFMLASSLEYQYSLTEKWRLALFTDQGNAFDSLSHPGLKTSAGFGVRWVSPVGPVRADIARPLKGSGGIHFHFSMGPEL